MIPERSSHHIPASAGPYIKYTRLKRGHHSAYIWTQ